MLSARCTAISAVYGRVPAIYLELRAVACMSCRADRRFGNQAEDSREERNRMRNYEERGGDLVATSYVLIVEVVL